MRDIRQKSVSVCIPYIEQRLQCFNWSGFACQKPHSISSSGALLAKRHVLFHPV
ncbi:hypothetical protein HMPREF9069_01018, partial [Atopobium sp. oral taxon 810 str. F0209]